ncbi:DNA cytosine methyltransferase [Leclercia sp. LSNIH1]|uniref:DNA cytosine methyltransferase n=1 Tax=Leclercia sp. LSNIH1 TaxID=1920114 RepID=UPI000CD27F09|nr:DNA cytosine methyltransferase [Leclercia sp. LSNIH1]AUU85018.1 cytosine methyltransferase [Leclercia sp. LSNIH1]POV32819.1 cytosine methyltransferase [Leclercia sp. LSNIH5]POW63520.1 cytosine methyltransferase [Leclercia sp. LSNIH2]
MKVIDLFSGVGGLSLGAARAGFEVSAAIEIDEHAIATHHVNFPNSRHFMEDVSLINGRELLNSINIDSLECLIGGPPCQGFSSIGKGDIEDVRNELYFHFFRIISEIQPLCFLAENVPGIMNNKYDPIRSKAFSLIENDYYILPPLKVKASDYGAPTTRTRIFFIGYKKSLGPELLSVEHFLPRQNVNPITVREALAGIDFNVDSNWQTESEGWRKINTDFNGTFYTKLWGDIPLGVGDEESLRLLKDNIVSGFMGTKHSIEIEKRYGNLKFGEMDRISKSKRLDPNGFCPTLRAGTGKEKGSFQAVRPIHPYQSRVISPREAARLQGFPDWFRFHNTKWHSFRQIGNSVCPLVAEAMLLPLANFCTVNSQNCTLENQGIAL